MTTTTTTTTTTDKLTCRECGREPRSLIAILGWAVVLGPAYGGPKRLKGSPLICFECRKAQRQP